MANPMHARLKLFTRMMQTDPVPLALAADLSIEAPAGYEAIQSALREWDAQHSVSMLPNVHLEHRALTRYSFLGPNVPLIDGWTLDFRPSEQFNLLELASNRGLRVEGADMCSLFTDLQIEAGAVYCLDFECAYSISPDNRSYVQLTWKAANGKAVQVQLHCVFRMGSRMAWFR